jgi:hypothetical protein
MAKKKRSKKTELKFKNRYLNKKMNGNIPGIELPKLYKDFTEEEKVVLYWHNPENTKVLFENTDNVPPRTLTENEEQIEIPQNEQTNEEEANDGE